MMMSAIVLLAVAGISVVWSFERILRKGNQSSAAYKVAAEADSTYLARRSRADTVTESHQVRLPARSHSR